MEVIREVALARYENLPEAEKVKTENDFKKITANNGDNNFSVSDLQKLLNIQPQVVDEILEVLELNMERRLDFGDFVTFMYMKEIPCLVTCEECSLLIRPGRCYFSCFECFLDNDSDSDSGYTLCCDCYRSKMFIGHEHSKFYDNFTLLDKTKSKIIATEALGSNRDKRNKFFDRLTIKFVNDFLVHAEKIKSYGWEEYLDKFLDFDMKDKFGEISLHLKELEDKKENATANITSTSEDIFDPIGPRPTIENFHAGPF